MNKDANRSEDVPHPPKRKRRRRSLKATALSQPNPDPPTPGPGGLERLLRPESTANDLTPEDSVPKSPSRPQQERPQVAPQPDPTPDVPAVYQAVEPVTPDHVMGWKTTTSGLEDYANWRLSLKDEKLEGDPPFRRGRIWA